MMLDVISQVWYSYYDIQENSPSLMQTTGKWSDSNLYMSNTPKVLITIYLTKVENKLGLSWAKLSSATPLTVG